MRITLSYLGSVLLLLWSQFTWSATLKLSQDLWPPYIMNSVQGSGIAHDIVADALISAGYDLKYTVKPWTRVLKETKSGQSDVIISLWKTEERQHFLLYTEPYMQNDMVFHQI